MRINKGLTKTDSPPYNAVFEAHRKFFEDICSGRMPPNADVYVPMPNVEHEVRTFTKTDTPSVGIIIGEIGIGKSSVLKHFRDTDWARSDTLCIFADLNQKTIDLPSTYGMYTDEQKRHAALVADLRLLTGKIHAAIRPRLRLDSDEIVPRLREFIEKENFEHIHKDSLFSDKSDRDILGRCQRRHPHQFAKMALKFSVKHLGLKHVIFVVDNTDNYDRFVIDGFIKSLGPAERCVESINAWPKIDANVTTLIACRPVTYAMLKEEGQRSLLASHGEWPIRIDSPCSLTELLRLIYVKGGYEACSEDIQFVSRNDIAWTVDKRNEFLHKLCHHLERDGHSDRIIELCNRNVADAKCALLEVLRNRFSFDFDRVLGCLADHDFRSQSETRLPWPDIVKCLAFGNPSESPVYPIRNSRIPNVLSSAVAPFPETMVKPRIIGLLAEAERSERALVSQTGHDLRRLLEHWFDKSQFDTCSLFEELYSQGLLTTHLGSPPSRVDAKTVPLVATPRGILLWDQLKSYSVLLECFRDDLELDEEHNWDASPTYEMRRDPTTREVIWLCEQAWRGERNELSVLLRDRDYDEFVRVFGARTIAECLLSGVQTLFLRYHQDIVRRWKADGLQDHLDNLAKSIKAQKKVWRAAACFRHGKTTEATKAANEVLQEFPGSEVAVEAEAIVTKCRSAAVQGRFAK